MQSEEHHDISYISWYYMKQLYFPEAERGLWRLQRRSNTRPNLGTARASGGLQQVLQTYIFSKISTRPSFLCLQFALSGFVNKISFIAVSARILLTSSPAMGDLTATMLMWPTTVRFWAHIDIKTTILKVNIYNFPPQLFHICYPVAYPDGQEEMLKWSFICPNQTIFDQVRATNFEKLCKDLSLSILPGQLGVFVPSWRDPLWGGPQPLWWAGVHQL